MTLDVVSGPGSDVSYTYNALDQLTFEDYKTQLKINYGLRGLF